MPVSIVVGGQYGSEGKGKVALHIARESTAAQVFVVRVGGTNSGHTGMADGETHQLRQLPASVLALRSIAVLPAGAIIDPDIFLREVGELSLDARSVVVSPEATVISDSDKHNERASGLVEQIGSTGSGTGAALARRISRRSGEPILAREVSVLEPFLQDTTCLLRSGLDSGARVVVEGTQGFGLSLLHGGHYPNATSRDTTAAGFLSETGLSPLDVDDVTLVVRAHPIRVAGNSGPLKGETTWAKIAAKAGLPVSFRELTTATKKTRRVGEFDPEIVKSAIASNKPTRLVLNHADYLDAGVRHGVFSKPTIRFIHNAEDSIGLRFDLIGTGPDTLVERAEIESTGGSTGVEMGIPA